MLDQPVAAEQLGEPAAVERPARAGAAAGARDAQPERGVQRAQALGVAQRGIGVGEQQVADRRRLGRLQVGVVGGERALRRAGVPGERGCLVEQRLVQLADAGARDQPKPDPERLATRPAGAQPARRRAADAPLELGLACVERVARCRVPGERVARDLVQLEQPAQQRRPVVAAQVAALDQRDGVGQVGEREAVRETRAVRALGRVGGRDQLARRASAQASAPSQLLDSGHAPETSCDASQRCRELDQRAERVAHVRDALSLRLVLRLRERAAAVLEGERIGAFDVRGDQGDLRRSRAGRSSLRGARLRGSSSRRGRTRRRRASSPRCRAARTSRRVPRNSTFSPKVCS